MGKKAVRIFALMLVIVFLLSTVSASAASVCQGTGTYSLVTCGDKLLRRTRVYVRVKGMDKTYCGAVLTVKKTSGCGVSAGQKQCVLMGNGVMVFDCNTLFGKVGKVEFTVSACGIGSNVPFYCSITTSDGSSVVRVKQSI